MTAISKYFFACNGLCLLILDNKNESSDFPNRRDENNLSVFSEFEEMIPLQIYLKKIEDIMLWIGDIGNT